MEASSKELPNRVVVVENELPSRLEEVHVLRRGLAVGNKYRDAILVKLEYLLYHVPKFRVALLRIDSGLARKLGLNEASSLPRGVGVLKASGCIHERVAVRFAPNGARLEPVQR